MQYEIKTLHGVETIFAPLPGANTTTIEIFVKAGSKYESEKTNGLSHFLEHMFFKGGKKYTTPKIVAETIDAFGGQFNAYTADNRAGYYVKCAPDYIHTAIDVLADMMVHAQFPQEEMEREKQVVLQEIAMIQDNPSRRVWSKWNQWYVGNNAFGRPVIGTSENVLSFTRDDLYAHQQGLYTKDNLVIVVAGAMPNQTDIENQIGELFGDLPEKKKIQSPLYTREQPAVRESFFDKGTEQNHVIISAPGYTEFQDERYAAKILAQILGGSMASRLFQEIREKKGLCYNIWAMHDAESDYGNYIIKAGIDKSRRDSGLAAIHEELAKFATGDVTQDEFVKAQGNIRGKTQMGIESSDQLASFVGDQRLSKGKIKSLEEILAQYQSVTIDQVKALAKDLGKKNLWSYWIS